MTYTIKGSPYFRIDDNGSIHLLYRLMYVHEDDAVLSVTANDGRYTTTVKLYITFTGAKIVSPTFNPVPSTISVNEFAEINTTILTLSCNSTEEIVYSIVSGDGNNVFNIGNRTGVISLAKTNPLSLTQDQLYTLEVQCSLKEFDLLVSDTVTITIHIDKVPLILFIVTLVTSLTALVIIIAVLVVITRKLCKTAKHHKYK